jgi:hypothetical protein
LTGGCSQEFGYTHRGVVCQVCVQLRVQGRASAVVYLFTPSDVSGEIRSRCVLVHVRSVVKGRVVLLCFHVVVGKQVIVLWI